MHVRACICTNSTHMHTHTRRQKYLNTLTNTHTPLPHSHTQVGKPQLPNTRFDDMYQAFLTVFIIMTMDDWTDIMFPLQKVRRSCACIGRGATPHSVPA